MIAPNSEILEPPLKRHLNIKGDLVSPSKIHKDQEDFIYKAVHILFRAGYRLKISEEATSTAIIFCHRYILSKTDFHGHNSSSFLVAATCLFLACKVNEVPRRLRDVINVTHKLVHPGSALPEPDKDYWSMKEKIVELEQEILRELNFDLEVALPYRFVYNYARSLRLPCEPCQRAVGLINSALFSSQCLRELSPPLLASAALYIAMELTKSSPKIHTSSNLPWWLVFGIEAGELEKACILLLDLHENCSKRSW